MGKVQNEEKEKEERAIFPPNYRFNETRTSSKRGKSKREKTINNTKCRVMVDTRD